MGPKTLWILLLVVGSSLGLACGQADEPAGLLPCYGKCEDGHYQSPWVVDMRNIADYGGKTGRYFFGLVVGEEIPQLSTMAAALDSFDWQVEAELRQEISARLSPDDAAGLVEVTFKVIWDQLHEVAAGWPTLIFADADAAREILPVIEAISVERGRPVSYQVVVIDADGRYVAAPGRLSLVPLLRDTAPSHQRPLRDAMRGGDVITYFHPELGVGSSAAIKYLMERRSSHVAMHYELKTLDGAELVHHIDNPKGYGPPYNHKPDRHMPFHFYRFAPSADRAIGAPEAPPFFVDENRAKQYRLAVQNWALVNSEIAPFAGFFDLRIKSFEDLETFVEGAMRIDPNRRKIPKVYCSALAFANLNLGLNRMLNAAGLGAHFGNFHAVSSELDREQLGWSFFDAAEKYIASDLEAPEDLRPIGQLVFEPYGVLDMLDAWIDNTFKGVPADAVDLIPSSEESTAPLREEMISIVINDPMFQRLLVGAFSNLQWSDSGGESGQKLPVATIANAGLWAMARGLKAKDKESFLDNPCDFTDNPECENLFDCSDNKKRSLRDAIANAGLEDVIAKAKRPYDVVRALAFYRIQSRFLPPRIWMDRAEEPDSLMTYGGTVLNCELLAAADGRDLDPCEGSGQAADHYLEGAADTHTYKHYAVKSGGQRTHRRIDAATGPQRWGAGTKATVRFTAPDAGQVLFALHVPAHYAGDLTVANTLPMSLRQYDGYCTSVQASGTCAPTVGIALQPQLSGKVLDKEIRFDVMNDAHCQPVNDQQLECDLVRLQVTNGVTKVVEQFRGPVDRWARSDDPGKRSYFAVTMINTQPTETPAAALPSECAVRQELGQPAPDDLSALAGCDDTPGSAHFDVFHIAVWDKQQVPSAEFQQ